MLYILNRSSFFAGYILNSLKHIKIIIVFFYFGDFLLFAVYIRAYGSSS